MDIVHKPRGLASDLCTNWIYFPFQYNIIIETYTVAYFKSNHCDSSIWCVRENAGVLFKCYFTDVEHFNTHHEVTSVNKLGRMYDV